MNYIKFTDWQELGLKKDIEKINDTLQHKESTILSFCWENVCFFFGFIISANLEDENYKITTFFICLLAGIIPIVINLVHKGFVFLKKARLASKGALKVSDKIDIFDNKICCLAMMGTSYVDMLATSYNSISQSEQLFLYQEINYYINKSIDEIYAMQPIVKKVFSNDYEEVKSKKLISLSRLYTIIEILEQSRPVVEIKDSNERYIITLNQSNSSIPVKIEFEATSQTKEIINFQNDINNKHQENLNTFKKAIADNFKNQPYFILKKTCN